MRPFYICSPEDNVVLILSHFWTPINITTAREGIKKISSTSSNIKAISPEGLILNWKDWIDGSNRLHYDNQPFLRSSSALYPVPTILLTSSNWCYRGRDRPTIEYLYGRFKGMCQICGVRFPLKKMSIEHILPKSKGGDDDWFNITMTCKCCNARKGSIFPYRDYKGNNLIAPNPIPFFHSFVKDRPEWGKFLFKTTNG